MYYMGERMVFRVFLVIFFCFLAPEAKAEFEFKNIADIHAMKEYIHSNFPLGTSRDQLRRVFVSEGGATQIAHPQNPNIEKYIYDINLCSWYLWRWNISADYDADGKLLQAYMNGEPVFAEGPQVQKVQAQDGKKQSILKVKTARPLAHKGESSLAFLVFDGDSDFKTIDDQNTMGGGPSRPDPLNMGKMHMYQAGSLWRTIFDQDETTSAADYNGDCATVDAVLEKAKAEGAKQ
jgi:hypothetical protein